MKPTSDVLLLSNDAELTRLVCAFFDWHLVTVASSPAEAARLLRTRRYRLVLVTNFGLSPQQAISVIPEERDYTVLFLTGYMDRSVEAACAKKKIPWRQMPVDAKDLTRELRIALDTFEP